MGKSFFLCERECYHRLKGIEQDGQADNEHLVNTARQFTVQGDIKRVIVLVSCPWFCHFCIAKKVPIRHRRSHCSYLNGSERQRSLESEHFT